MKIQFLGAAQTVTGSCYMMETGTHRFAVDCGMHQGNREIERRNFGSLKYRPQNVDFFLITHAHIDHSGLLPRMVQNGFKGKIYCTPPTKGLLEIMLRDSAHIQEMEAEWKSRKRSRRGKGRIDPLYTMDDVERTLELLTPVEYGAPFEPFPELSVCYRDAGHILGSAFIELCVKEDGKEFKVVFSGDLGRPDQLIVRDPSIIRDADYLFLESTYGDRNHKDEQLSRDELAEAIDWSYSHGEKVIIPAFAVERTQEVLYTLHILSKEGRLPQGMPVYVDSPMAIRATEVFRNHPEYYDNEALKIVDAGEDPLSTPNLHFTLGREESTAINASKGPGIVISASGMCNAGRIKHHLRHNLWKPGASVVFVGYQGKGTPGRKIVDGAKRIRILGDEIAVRAKIFTIGGFSAHAGQSQILEWLEHFRTRTMKVFLVHGENSAQETLADLIRKKFGLEVHIPGYLDICTMEADEPMALSREAEKAKPTVDWQDMLGRTNDLVQKMEDLKKQMKGRSWEDQTELRDRLDAIHRELEDFISEV